MSMPKGAAGSGKCNTSSPYLTITFGPHDDKLTMHFAQKDSSTYIENVSLNFTMDKTFPGSTVPKKGKFFFLFFSPIKKIKCHLLLWIFCMS